MAKNWKSITDDREKYAAYLCSREWSVLKEAVHRRAGGRCERCHVFPIDSVHHVTYARKYNESLDDLEGHCKHCHAFTHGKGKFDPGSSDPMTAYIRCCVSHPTSRVPIPVLVVKNGPSEKMRFYKTVSEQIGIMQDMAYIADRYCSVEPNCCELIYGLVWDVDREAGFNISDLPDDWFQWNHEMYSSVLECFGFEDSSDRGFADTEPDNQEA